MRSLSETRHLQTDQQRLHAKIENLERAINDVNQKVVRTNEILERIANIQTKILDATRDCRRTL